MDESEHYGAATMRSVDAARDVIRRELSKPVTTGSAKDEMRKLIPPPLEIKRRLCECYKLQTALEKLLKLSRQAWTDDDEQ